MDTAAILDNALKDAGIPVEGVSIGDPGNRATWKIVFAAAATPAQRTAGANILQSAAVDANAELSYSRKVAQMDVDNFPLQTRAIILALIDQLNVIRAALPTPKPDITPAQALAAVRAKAGTL